MVDGTQTDEREETDYKCQIGSLVVSSRNNIK